MIIDRRRVLAGLAAASLLPVAPLAAAGRPAFVAARREADGSHAAAVFTHDGEILFTERLDGRGHDAALSPDGRTAVVFARRPGHFAVVIDLAARRRATAFAPPPDRHFYGHGLFSRDGRLLYATENDFDAERGVLGVYDVGAGYRRIGELDCGGIGPHEAILLADGRTIAVANGGIATHPDYPRLKLNIATMAPSLAYVDVETGDLLGRASLPAALHQLSLRHMAEAADGTVWIGGQYEGPRSDRLALVARHRRGGDIALLEAPPALWPGFDHYVGSVAASRDGGRIAVSSPRGGLVLVFDARTGSVLSRRSLPDACGLAPRGAGFLASDGAGRLWQGEGEGAPLAAHEVSWDNHIAAV